MITGASQSQALNKDCLFELTIENQQRLILSVGSQLTLVSQSARHQILTTIILQRAGQESHNQNKGPSQMDSVKYKFDYFSFLVQPLRFNQCFYIKFYFTDHYLWVDPDNLQLGISKDNKTLFRILSNETKKSMNDLIKLDHPLQFVVSDKNSLSLALTNPVKQNASQKYKSNQKIQAVSGQKYSPMRLFMSTYQGILKESIFMPSLLYQLQSQKYLSWQSSTLQELYNEQSLQQKIMSVFLPQNNNKIVSVGKLMNNSQKRLMSHSFLIQRAEPQKKKNLGLLGLLAFQISSQSQTRQNLQKVKIKIQNSQKKLYVRVDQGNKNKVIACETGTDFFLHRYPEEQTQSNLIILQDCASGLYLKLSDIQPKLSKQNKLSCIIEVKRCLKKQIRHYIQYFRLVQTDDINFILVQSFIQELQKVSTTALGDDFVLQLIEDGIMKILQKYVMKQSGYVPMILKIFRTLLQIYPQAVLVGLFKCPKLYKKIMESQLQEKILKVDLKMNLNTSIVQSPRILLQDIEILTFECQQKSLACSLAVKWGSKLINDYHLTSTVIQNLWNKLINNAESVVTSKLLLLIDSIIAIKGRRFHDDLVSKLQIQQTLKDSSLSPQSKLKFMRKHCQTVPASCLTFNLVMLQQQARENFPVVPILQSQTFQDHLSSGLVTHYRVLYPAQKLTAILCAQVKIKYGNISHTENQLFRLTLDIVRNNIDNFTYDIQQLPQFVGNALKIAYEAIKKYIQVVCRDSIVYDSHALTQEKQIAKCVQQVKKISKVIEKQVNLQIIWNYLIRQTSVLPKQKAEVLIYFLKFLYLTHQPEKQIFRTFHSMSIIQETTKSFKLVLNLIYQGVYVYQPQKFMRKFINLAQDLTIQEMQALNKLLILNKMLLPIVQDSSDRDLSFHFLSYFPHQQLINYIAVSLGSRSKFEVLFLRKMLSIMSIVGNDSLYETYENYITHAPPQIYSIDFIKLAIQFVQKCPKILQRRFVKNYQFYVLVNKKNQIEKKISSQRKRLRGMYQHDGFQQQGQTQKFQLVESFLQLLLILKKVMKPQASEEKSQFGQQMQNYQGHQDEWLPPLLIISLCRRFQIQRFKLKVFGIQLLSQFQVLQIDNNFMLQSNQFIRNQIQIIKRHGHQQFESPSSLPRYVNALILLLKVRETAKKSKNKFSENQLLAFDGTNKLLTFQLIDLIEDITQSRQGLLQNVNWLEARYKLTINNDSIGQFYRPNKDEQKLMRKPSQQQQVSTIVLRNQSLGTLPSDNLIETFPLILTVTYFLVLKRVAVSQIAFLLRAVLQIFRKKSDSDTKLDHNIKYVQISTQIMLQCHLNKDYLHLLPLVQEILIRLLKQKGEIITDYQYFLQSHIISNFAIYLTYVHKMAKKFRIWGHLQPNYQDKKVQEYEESGTNLLECPEYAYSKIITLLTILSRSLNFEFKQIFGRKILGHDSLIVKIIETLNQCIKYRHFLTQIHLDLINSLLHGPMQQNIKLSLASKYDQIITPLLRLEQNWSLQTRKSVSQAFGILVDYRQADYRTINLFQKNLQEAYKEMFQKYAQKGDLVDKIVNQYDQLAKNNQLTGLQLLLSTFYCLARMYQKRGDNTIKDIRTKNLRQKKLAKTYNKNFKILYQIYRIIRQTFSWAVGKCFRFTKYKTQKVLQENEIDFEFDLKLKLNGQQKQVFRAHQKSKQLFQAFKFLVRNTARVDIQIGQNMHTEYFLLMRQAHCYNTSIRKSLHRKIGTGNREYRMKKFMEVSNYIILRLEIEKNIKNFIQRYKPLQIIIKNRQLWKSLNFFCATFLNLAFLYQQIMNQEFFEASIYLLRSLIYMFCIFLFAIYFVQNLPLKIRIIKQRKQEERKGNKLTQCLKDSFQILNDKTLWYAFIYFITISISFYELGFVAILMFDFFIRFKISKKVTDILIRPLLPLVMVILFMLEIIYLYTCFVFAANVQRFCAGLSSCIQINFLAYMGVGKNFNPNPATVSIVTFPQVVEIYFRHVNIFVNVSLIISLLLFEKKSKDIRDKEKKDSITAHCFICDALRSDVDRKRNDNKGFFEHVESEHNLWNYVFYLVYLKNRKTTDLSVIETNVLQQWKKNKIQWLPNRDQ